ncbi:hypothetical protein N0V83_006788 [Neocucurbitaria cava]|uniref:Uncharacterized protein n=1 Tax=Neocucurbitaria cava TaxID=798079 RepID=A0A9W9CLB3_9PLEO|nr:hypothetical protein N0V83_006788 [Neocucurbitaria cava]
MSFPTQPAYVHYGTWDDKSRQHEYMKWMEQYTNAVDRKAWDTEPSSNWFAPTHTLHKTSGETVSGGDASWAALRTEVYAPFAAHLHDPQFFVVWEKDDGWEMLGVATLYWNLAAPGGSGEKKSVKGRDGKEWDGAGPAAFNFHYVKGSDGQIRMKSSATYADPSTAVVGMLKKGMMKPEDLLK